MLGVVRLLFLIRCKQYIPVICSCTTAAHETGKELVFGLLRAELRIRVQIEHNRISRKKRIRPVPNVKKPGPDL